MRYLSRATRIVTAIGAGALIGGAVVPALATEIGSVTAANPTIHGTPPNTRARVLKLGERVFADEVIITSNIGSGQFVFLDQTTLTVSPGSEIVLDQYVFDPERGSGDIALTLSKGVLRFIGGRITKSGEATITTPHATIGIRGGMAAITVGDAGTNAVFLAGTSMRVSGKTKSIVVTRTGGMVTVPAGEAGGGESGTGEPTYQGVASEEDIAGIYDATDTGGDGGTTQTIDTTSTDTLAQDSGLTDVGAGAPGATTPATESADATTTTGDTQDDPVSEVRSEPENTPTAGLPPEDIVEGGGGSGGGEPPPGGQPLPDLTGLAFVAPIGAFTASDGTLVADPEGQRVVESAAGRFPFAAVFEGSRRGETAAGESFLVPVPETFGFYLFGDAFPDGTLGNGDSPFGTTSGVGFHDPVEDFTLAVFETNTPDPRLGYALFGAPTPGQLVETFGESVPVRLYDLGFDLLWGLDAPLPPAFGDIFDGGQGTALHLIAQPNATFLGNTSLLGFDNPHQSKWLYGFLDIQGTGAAQNILIAGLAAQALPNDAGAPTANDFVRSFFTLGGGGSIGTQSLVAGTVQDPAGNTVFGDGGEYIAFGTSAPFLTDGNDPDLDFLYNSYTVFDRSFGGDGQESDLFGTLRLASLEGSEVLGGLASRTPLAAPLGVTNWSPTAPVGEVFTGGYAAGMGQSHIPGGDGIGGILPAPYVFRSPDGGGVLMGFDAGGNAAVAEFAPMQTFGSADIFDITLNFGDGFSHDAMLDDARFAMDESPGADGPLTGQALSISGIGAPVSGGGQTAMQGVLLSAELVGDGGIFPAGTDTTPEYLRWGWWGASYAFGSGAEGAFASREEVMPLGTWVSGVRSDIAELGTSGEATFDGLATAHIVETGGASPVSYVDGGRYLMTFDFGSRTGTASISGIVDTTFTAIVSEAGAAAGNHFGGVLRDASTFAAVGALDGSFFTGGADPAAATAGAFDFARDIGGGVTQTGAGAFAADRVVP